MRLAFDAYHSRDDYISEFLVRVDAAGLSATVLVITSAGGDGLPGFIRGLVDDFRGWEGSRSWRSFEDQLRIDATWQSRGHVAMVFHLSPSVYDKWAVRVEVTLEAGEELKRLGDDLEDFVSSG